MSPREKKKKPKVRVLPWPAVPVPTQEDVYGGEERERKEKMGKKGRGKKE